MFATFDKQTRNSTAIVTAARKTYQEKYTPEIELNETLNRFASNYRLAYQGPNTARAQIFSRFNSSELVAISELSTILRSCICVV